jgi:hypothetical protein
MITIFYLREHTNNMGSVLSCYDFEHNARCPIRPHMAIKPEIGVSAGGKAFIHLSL